jgi:hypothetical protein
LLSSTRLYTPAFHVQKRNKKKKSQSASVSLTFIQERVFYFLIEMK